MVSKLELFEQYDGKQFLVAEGTYIVCNLNRSWSREKMQQTIEKWEADGKNHLAFQNWKTKLAAHAATLHYFEGDLEWRARDLMISLQAFGQSQGIEKDIKELEKRLFLQPSKHQWGIVETLTKPGDRHVRLYGDGRIAASNSSEGIWHCIQLDGSYSQEEGFPVNTTLYSHHTLIKLSDVLGVEVQVSSSTLRAHVYFNMQHGNPKWFVVDVWQAATPEGSEQLVVQMGGYGDMTPEIAYQAGDGLKLGAAIAQDFKAFLDSPHEWLSNLSS